MKDTGVEFFGLKVKIESTGDDEVDAAIKTVFYDHYRRTAPLTMTRPDVKIVMEWAYK